MRDSSIGWSEALGEWAAFPKEVRVSGTYTIVIDGKEIPIAPLENRIKARFEDFVRRGSELAIAGMDNPAVQNRYAREYLRDRGAGAYNWPMDGDIEEAGSAVRQALDEPHGQKHLLYLLMLRCDGKASEADASNAYRKAPRMVGDALRWALGTGDDVCNSESDSGSGSKDDATRGESALKAS